MLYDNQCTHEFAAGKPPAIAVHADGLANGLDLGVGGGVRQLLAAVDAGGKFGSGGVVQHRTHGDGAGRRALGDV